MAAGLWMLYDTANPLTARRTSAAPQYALSKLGFDDTKVTIYTGILALVVNPVVGFVVTARADGQAQRTARRSRGDYEVEAGDPRVEPLPRRHEEQAVPANR